MSTKRKLVCETVHLQPSSSSAFCVNVRACVLRSRSADMCAGSFSAVMAAIEPSTLMLKGNARRDNGRTVSRWPMEYPMRIPAMPYAFENVRATNTFGVVIASGMAVEYAGSVTYS